MFYYCSYDQLYYIISLIKCPDGKYMLDPPLVYRWYLIHAQYRKIVKKSEWDRKKPSTVVFVSTNKEVWRGLAPKMSLSPLKIYSWIILLRINKIAAVDGYKLKCKFIKYYIIFYFLIGLPSNIRSLFGSMLVLVYDRGTDRAFLRKTFFFSHRSGVSTY